jgi:DNA-binding beta-propeller fold protein YncE
MKDTSIPPEDQTLNLEVVEDINVESASDSNKCDITGIEVIQPDKIIVCDNYNLKVKCYDTVQKKTVSEIKLHIASYDAAAITYDRFVVTVPNIRCVQFMSLKKKHIVSDRKVKINEECLGIAYSRDRLVVSCNGNPGNVLVLDIQGKILQSICGGKSVFCFPHHVALNTAGTSIYVNDSSVKAVKQLDWQGNIINTYQPAHRGEYLGGICELNDGTFLICLIDGELRRISDSCKPCKITINQKLDRWYPNDVLFCKKTRKLYVSYSKTGEHWSRNCIKVFKVE